MTAPIPPMPRVGDLLFYRGDDSLSSRLILWRTAPGPYVHVEIALGDGTAIAALSQGVVRHKIVDTPDVFSPQRLTPLEAIHKGLVWLEGEVGDSYGWMDILDDILPSKWRVLLMGRRAFDCSHLAAQYLIEAGLASLLGSEAATPQIVTPNSLARACGLLR